MTWADIEARWHEITHVIRARWPATNAETLAAIAGNRETLARHLADVHGLTHAEAADAIEDWLALLAARSGR